MKKIKNKSNTDYSLAHVLYQKLGSDWYAFAEVDGDCFMTKVDAKVAKESAIPSDISSIPNDAQSRGRRKAA